MSIQSTPKPACVDHLPCVKQVLDVEVPAGQHMATGHSHWVEVVHGEGVFTALLPGLQHCMEDQVPEGATGIRKRTIVSGQHFQLAVPSSWRSRKLSGMEYDVGSDPSNSCRFTLANLVEQRAVMTLPHFSSECTH